MNTKDWGSILFNMFGVFFVFFLIDEAGRRERADIDEEETLFHSSFPPPGVEVWR